MRHRIVLLTIILTDIPVRLACGADQKEILRRAHESYYSLNPPGMLIRIPGMTF